MPDEPWWEQADPGSSERRSDSAREVPPPRSRTVPPTAPHTSAAASTGPAPSADHRSAGEPRIAEPGWQSGRTSTRSYVITGLIVVALVIAVLVLRMAGDDSNDLEATLDAVDAALGDGDELDGDAQPTRDELGLDDRFTRPRAWRVGDTIVVAYARRGSTDDRARVETEGTIAAALLEAAGDGAVVTADAIAGSDPLVRVVELELGGDSTAVAHATAIRGDDAAVVVVSASGPTRPAIDVGVLAALGVDALD